MREGEKGERRLVIVTATTDPVRAEACMNTWGTSSRRVVVWNNARDNAQSVFTKTMIVVRDYLGTVPAFCRGIERLMIGDWSHPQNFDRECIVAMLHDDVLIFDPHWDETVLNFFESHPHAVLAGFFGAKSLGHPQIYELPYDPMQLARGDCWSSMIDAEAHGSRTKKLQRVAVLDGFSQIMRGDFARYALNYLRTSGLVHHAYDAALGALARRFGGETWLIPISCKHLGGQTAVGDAGYQEWARRQIKDGDQGFWLDAHRKVYDEFQDQLPFKVE